MIAADKYLDWDQVQDYLSNLQSAIDNRDFIIVDDIFKKTVSGYKSEIKDKII